MLALLSLFPLQLESMAGIGRSDCVKQRTGDDSDPVPSRWIDMSRDQALHVLALMRLPLRLFNGAEDLLLPHVSLQLAMQAVAAESMLAGT